MKRLLLVIALFGCSATARRSESVTGHPPALTTPEEKHGELVFMKTCNQCHPLGEGGLGPTINNKPLPGAIIKAKVRTGLGGDMPHFSEQELSSKDLDDVIAYLKAIRRSK